MARSEVSRQSENTASLRPNVGIEAILEINWFCLFIAASDWLCHGGGKINTPFRVQGRRRKTC